MRYRSHVVASIGVTLALAGIAAAALARIPAGAQLPVHWGPDGAADRFADAAYAVFLPVALSAFVSIVMTALPDMEPLQDRLDRSAVLYRTAWAGVLGVMVLTEAVVAGPAFGWTPPPTTMLVGVGALLVVIGNALPKSRPGFFVGIRTPWTLIDPDNWIATHRLGGRIMIASGLAVIAVALLPVGSGVRAQTVIAALLVTVAAPVVYSFALWRRTSR